MSKHFRRALEMIEVQTDHFGRDLEDLFSELIEDRNKPQYTGSKLKKHPAVTTIQDLTFKRTGVKVELILNSYLAACLPFYPNQYSAIVRNEFRGKMYDDPFYKQFFTDQLKVLDKSMERKGTVDLKKAKVGGFFSEYVNPVFMNIRQLVSLEMSPGEITAIYLHELGHCFTAYEYSNRLNSHNVVLGDLARTVLDKKELPRDYLFKELKKINEKTTKEEIDQILDGDNTILGRATMKYLRETVESQIPNGWYDETANETLADNFSTRFGYATELVTSLEKLGLDSEWSSQNSVKGAAIATLFSVFILSYQISIIATCLLVIKKTSKGGLKTDSIPLFLMAGIWTFIVVFTLMAHSRFAQMWVYDETKFRYKRIRDQLVSMLKDVDLFSNAQTIDVIDQIRELDEILSQRNKYANLVTVLVDLIKPSSHANDADVQLQRLLEGLSANDLYIKAAALRTAV